MHLRRRLREQPRAGRQRRRQHERVVLELFPRSDAHAPAREVDSLHPRREPDVRAEIRGNSARQGLDSAFARVPERGVVADVLTRGAGGAVHYVLERRPGDETAAPFRREMFTRHRVQLLVVREHEVPGESFTEMAEDELLSIRQRPRAQLLAARTERRIDESENAVRDRARREPIEMKLVGKRGPNSFTIDARAPLHLEQVSAEPAFLDQLAHLRIARVQPVPGPVE